METSLHEEYLDPAPEDKKTDGDDTYLLTVSKSTNIFCPACSYPLQLHNFLLRMIPSAFSRLTSSCRQYVVACFAAESTPRIPTSNLCMLPFQLDETFFFSAHRDPTNIIHHRRTSPSAVRNPLPFPARQPEYLATWRLQHLFHYLCLRRH